MINLDSITNENNKKHSEKFDDMIADAMINKRFQAIINDQMQKSIINCLLDAEN